MSYQDDLRRGMDIIGPLDTGMEIDSFSDPAKRVHERNVEHLRAYVEVRRTASHGSCAEAPMCNGVAYVRALRRRSQSAGYIETMLQSAVAEIDRLMAESSDARSEAARERRLVVELRARLARLGEQARGERVKRETAEELVAGVRDYVPEPYDETARQGGGLIR